MASHQWERPPIPEPCETELLAEARAICRDRLDLDPTDASALHRLGVLSAKDRQDDLAIACFRRAMELDEKSRNVILLGDLADALDRQGRHAESVSTRLQVLQRLPRDPKVYQRLGETLQRAGKSTEAVAAFQEAVRLQPAHVVTLALLGDALGAAGRIADALASYEECLRLRPDYTEMYGRIGRLHLKRRDWRLALGTFEAGLCCAGLRDADKASLTFGVGETQILQREYACAETTLRDALSLEPSNLEALSRLIFVLELLGKRADAAQAWLSLGVALEERARVREAMAAYQQVLVRMPDCLDAQIRLGSLHLLIGEVPPSVRHLEAAVATAPDHVVAHGRLGCARHLNGETDRGWDEFGWLFSPQRIKLWHAWEQPMWDGSSLGGQTILVWAPPDSGLGDTLQFVRCARLLHVRGAHRVIVECQRSLASLIASVPGVSRVVSRLAPPPPFDVHAPLMLVPVLDRAARDGTVTDVPYVVANQAHVDIWREHLGFFDGMTVGLCWHAQTSRQDARVRSAPLSAFAPLAGARDVRFVSLQLGPLGDEAFVPPAELHVRRMLAESATAAHTAALIQSLDLVITVDTMIAHLAGALGRPVWTLLPRGADWRWGHEDTTPWYPTMRLFRQERVNDWGSVLEHVREALAECSPVVRRPALRHRAHLDKKLRKPLRNYPK